MLKNATHCQKIKSFFIATKTLPVHHFRSEIFRVRLRYFNPTFVTQIFANNFIMPLFAYCLLAKFIEDSFSSYRKVTVFCGIQFRVFLQSTLIFHGVVSMDGSIRRQARLWSELIQYNLLKFFINQ